jgi:hypothetical protein
VADGVHGLVDAVEVSARGTLAHSACTEAHLAELPEPHDPVLPGSHGRDLGVERKLNTLRDPQSRFVLSLGHGAQDAGAGRAWVLQA